MIILKIAVESWELEQYNLLKLIADIHFPDITNIINLSISKSYFPDKHNCTEVNPIFKNKNDLDNYRPVSALKIFKRIIYHQTSDCMAE